MLFYYAFWDGLVKWGNCANLSGFLAALKGLLVGKLIELQLVSIAI